MWTHHFNSFAVLPLLLIWCGYMYLQGDGIQCIFGCDSSTNCNFVTSFCTDYWKLQVPSVAAADQFIFEEYSRQQKLSTEMDKADQDLNLRDVPGSPKIQTDTGCKTASVYMTPYHVVIMLVFLAICQHWCFFSRTAVVNEVAQHLNAASNNKKRAVRQDKVYMILKSYHKAFPRAGHICWLAEAAGNLIVIAQCCVMAWFGGNALLSSFPLMPCANNMGFLRWKRTDQLYMTFPSLVNCPFRAALNESLGLPVDSRNSLDTLCYLPNNSVHEAVFAAVFYWVICFLWVMVCSYIDKCCSILSSNYRNLVFKRLFVGLEDLTLNLDNFKLPEQVTAGEVQFLFALKRRVCKRMFGDFMKVYIDGLKMLGSLNTSSIPEIHVNFYELVAV